MHHLQDTVTKQHLLYLTERETDRCFDPFDPHDDSLPSHLHHVGHRYIKQEVYDWLLNNVCSQQERDTDHITSYRHWSQSVYRRVFMFESKDAAMQFKLAWSGT